mgnify:CR=1 FL=1
MQLTRYGCVSLIIRIVTYLPSCLCPWPCSLHSGGQLLDKHEFVKFILGNDTVQAEWPIFMLQQRLLKTFLKQSEWEKIKRDRRWVFRA